MQKHKYIFFCFRCDSVQKLKNRIDYLKSILNDQSTFKSIYRYAYDFARVSILYNFIIPNIKIFSSVFYKM